MLSCKEIAEKWGVSVRAVSGMCSSGRIEGAVKIGKIWNIPENAKKPTDDRVVTGRYSKKNQNTDKKALPIGISDYIRAQAEYYYVDKTLMIKDFLDKKPLVSLFTRPRRFGKTLNMDMLRVFFEISDEDTAKYFYNKKIWQCGEKYTKHQGRYPIIFLTFKDVKFDNWNDTLDKIKSLLQVEYGRHSQILDSDNVPEYEKEYFQKVVRGEAEEVELTASLENLSRMLDECYGAAPIIIIDEYDTPIQEGHTKDFYDEIISFMRTFFSGAFKDNKHITYGFLTGILRIAQESIFSGLNNLVVDSVFDEEYSSYFGFTRDEITDMLKYYGITDRYQELTEWYDGYRFGNTDIFNPWSVINYVAKGCTPQAYWVNTGRNEILGEVLGAAGEDVSEKLNVLMQGKTVLARIDQNVVYSTLGNDPYNVYSMLLVAGYLKATDRKLQSDGTYMCRISIPNREIAAVYKNEVTAHMLQIGAVSQATANKIAESLYEADTERLNDAIKEYLDKSISYYDSAAEGFYHGLTLGMIALMDDKYEIKSNRESGNGRYDICMIPRVSRYPGIIIELKAASDKGAPALADMAEKALEQICDKRYDSELRSRGVSDIVKMGIAFSGKNVSIKSST